MYNSKLDNISQLNINKLDSIFYRLFYSIYSLILDIIRDGIISHLSIKYGI